MIIDIAAHCLPPRHFARVYPLARPEWRATMDRMPGLADLDTQRQTVARYAERDYRQVLSVSIHGTEDPGYLPQLPEMSRAVNDELWELVAAEPGVFASALGVLPLADPPAAARELDHLVELELPGFQCYSSVMGRPLDGPVILEVLEEAFRRGLACFLHPARDPLPDYPGETRSRFALFRVLGWPYETSLALMRLVFSGVFDRQPEAVVIAHHLGGMIPFVAPRIEAHYMREDDPDLRVGLAQNPIEYLRRLCEDTAINGGPHAIRCGVDFFGNERVLFGSDYPFDGQAGVMYLDRTLAAVDEAGFDHEVREAILAGNARRLLRLA